MLHHQTFLRCSRQTATVTIFAIFLLFLILGCASMLRKAGMTNDQPTDQAAQITAALGDAAAEAVADIPTGLAQDKDLPALATDTASAFAWKIAAIAASTIGAVLSALLAKWLGTERKITQAMITGIEKAPNNNVKESVKDEAFLAGIQNELHARVKALP